MKRKIIGIIVLILFTVLFPTAFFYSMGFLFNWFGETVLLPIIILLFLFGSALYLISKWLMLNYKLWMGFIFPVLIAILGFSKIWTFTKGGQGMGSLVIFAYLFVIFLILAVVYILLFSFLKRKVKKVSKK